MVGTSGAGKTTLARKIATLLELQHIELDAINWQSGWRDLTRHDPEEFVRRVAEVIAAEAWVVDGNYGPVRDRVWQRATHLVWLDYERPVFIDPGSRAAPAAQDDEYLKYRHSRENGKREVAADSCG